jgi:hypothetical protein
MPKLHTKLNGSTKKSKIVKFIHKHNKISLFCLFLALALIIFSPFIFKKGFILTLDMVFAPNYFIQWNDLTNGYWLYNSIPLQFTMELITKIVSGEYLQKLILIFIFTLMGYAFYQNITLKNQYAKFLGAVLYMWNPFVHERLLAGHWHFLFAYALTPYFFKFCDNFFLKNKSNFKYLVKFIFFWTLIIILNAHHSVLLGIVFLTYFFISLLNKKTLKIKLIKKTILALAILIFINSFWLIPYILMENPAIKYFNLEHFYAFSGKPDFEYGLTLNLLGMYGFWREGVHLPIAKIFLKNYWLLIFFPIFLLILIGIISQIKKKHRSVIIFIIGMMTFFLALGPSPETYKINQWIFEHVPGFKGMREPQKFLALTIYAYSFFLTYGIAALFKKMRIYNKHIKSTLLTICVFAIIITYSFTLAFGAQLKLSSYPINWYSLKKEIKNNEKILSLPWHQYGNYPFIKTNVLDPTPYFFGKNVISSKDFELVNVKNKKLTEQEKLILNLIKNKNSEKWQRTLNDLDIKYIILHKNFDMNEYEFLKKFQFLKIYSNGKYSLIYKIQNNKTS